MSARTVEPGLWHALRVWWAFTWRWPLLILLPFAPIALAVFLIKPGPEAAMRVISWAAWPMVAFAQVDALRRVLKADFPDFSVRLLERHPHE